MGMCFFFTVKGTQIKTDRSYADMKGRVAPTFDGRIWLAKDHPEDLAIIQWLQENGKNGDTNGKPPTILEAISDETYSYFGRISAFTGFPAVIGWANHEGIWRSHNAKVNKHKQDGRMIFNSQKLGESCRLTKEYGIDFIVLGELERQEFPVRLLKGKFLPYTDVVFATGESSIRSKWNRSCEELDNVHPEGIVDRTDETPPATVKALPVIATIGGPGETFKEPRGLSFGPDGRLYICDSRNYRIQVYSSEGIFERTIPDPSETSERAKLGSQEWGGPGDVAVAEDGAVYVADTWGSPPPPQGGYGRIVKYDNRGKFLSEWASPQGFFGPRGLALADNGDVYVSDTGNKRVQVFDKDGRFLRVWGGEGNSPGQFIEHVGMAVRGEQVYVCDTGNQRVQVFSTAGQQLFQFIPYGWGGNAVGVEPHLSVDGQGNIYLSDSFKGYLEVFSPQGDPILKYFRGLSRPSGIEVSGNRGAVSELGSNTVKVFSIE
jgi:DNA-binding beta-propeller fold protein YncE